MTTPAVTTPSYDPANEKPFGPARIEHRTAGAGLSELGTYFMTFDRPGYSDPWTVQYEETIFVIEGRARLVVVEPRGDREVLGEPGDLLVLPKGSTVRYGGDVGTLLLLSISPVNWRDVNG